MFNVLRIADSHSSYDVVPRDDMLHKVFDGKLIITNKTDILNAGDNIVDNPGYFLKDPQGIFKNYQNDYYYASCTYDGKINGKSINNYLYESDIPYIVIVLEITKKYGIYTYIDELYIQLQTTKYSTYENNTQKLTPEKYYKGLYYNLSVNSSYADSLYYVKARIQEMPGGNYPKDTIYFNIVWGSSSNKYYSYDVNSINKIYIPNIGSI